MDRVIRCVFSGPAIFLRLTIVIGTITGGSVHHVAVALGSNLGDRFANVELALRLIPHPLLYGQSTRHHSVRHYDRGYSGGIPCGLNDIPMSLQVGRAAGQNDHVPTVRLRGMRLNRIALKFRNQNPCWH